MIYACGAKWNQASNILHDSLVFDSFILVRTNGPFYKVLAEDKNTVVGPCESDVYKYMMSSYAPASVVTIFGDGVAIKETLRMVPVNKRRGRVRVLGRKI
jgi:hypothetical protein